MSKKTPSNKRAEMKNDDDNQIRAKIRHMYIYLSIRNQDRLITI